MVVCVFILGFRLQLRLFHPVSFVFQVAFPDSAADSPEMLPTPYPVFALDSLFTLVHDHEI